MDSSQNVTNNNTLTIGGTVKNLGSMHHARGQGGKAGGVGEASYNSMIKNEEKEGIDHQSGTLGPNGLSLTKSAQSLSQQHHRQMPSSQS